MGNSGHTPRATRGSFGSNLSPVGSRIPGKRPNKTLQFVLACVIGVLFGFMVGNSASQLSTSKLNAATYLVPSVVQLFGARPRQNRTPGGVWVESNPKGAESLPPGIVESESDLYFRRLWGDPSEDLKTKPKYLVAFTVGYEQRHHIDASLKQFSEDFTIVLFHYDGRTTEWDQFEWSKRVIHVSARKQTKWWFAKRFLHPDIVKPYEYIFVWDEDLGVENFNAEKYIELVKKYGLEISQPGLEPNSKMAWRMTERRNDTEVHKVTEERPGWCTDPHLPPCAGFVEIMAPVFSREAWRCVWHMIQNDLVHGWGLDLALQKCVQPAHEKIGVVDAQWVVHKQVPSLGNQGELIAGVDAPWRGVRLRCEKEWQIFKDRMKKAEEELPKYTQA